MKYCTVLLAAIVFGFVTACGQTTWKVDKSHSNVRFTVSHMVIAEVDGRFTDFDVVFQSDGEDFAGASVEAIIMTASVNTDNERRDNHLRSADFFDAEKHPEMKFKSAKFAKVSDTKYKVSGDLTIRGNTKPVTLDVTFRGKITDGRGNNRIAWKGTTTIDRFEFGTVWNKALETGNLVVGREVGITINLEMTEEKPGQGG